jgi:hypothetical protein
MIKQSRFRPFGGPEAQRNLSVFDAHAKIEAGEKAINHVILELIAHMG